MISPAVATELEAALLQGTITLGVAGLCGYLWLQYRKRYFLWWAVAWLLYGIRLGVIMGFLVTSEEPWLFLHQVLTGCTALALLWTALVFSQQLRWRWRYLLLALFPLVWSYIAIYQLRNFLLAALPAVVFLAAATLWTAWVFLRYASRRQSRSAWLLGITLVLWAAHHLDYPFLRARGAWVPWGYNIDILFILSLGAGIVLLVGDELSRGLRTLSVLSGDLQRGGEGAESDAIDALLARPLALGGVRGSALYVGGAGEGRFVRGIGACAAWTDTRAAGAARRVIAVAVERGRPEVGGEWTGEDAATGATARAYVSALPILRGPHPAGALVILGDERDPFAALGTSFLLALGQHVGAALENADLYRRLETRTRQLEHLSARMVQQQEEERRRIVLELHDETAQIFSTVKLQLGLLREASPADVAARLDRVLALVDAGMRSIRNLSGDLRPPLLDDLGLLPALRALVAGFGERTGLEVALDMPPVLPPLAENAELALYRALQEALSNVARHAAATHTDVRVAVEETGCIRLDVTDDGTGMAEGAAERAARDGHLGLAGMRERLGALGGSVQLGAAGARGLALSIRLPVRPREAVA